MGVDTDPEKIGDLYLLRKKTPYTELLSANINIEGYDFVSEVLLNS